MRAAVRNPASVALAVCLCLTAAPAAADVELPVTFAKAWYRLEDKGALMPRKGKGDLTISASTVDFLGDKTTLSLPLEEIEMASLGTMRGDVNTSWTVLRLVGGAEIGFRDGRKAGYGGRTGEMFDALWSALRGAGAGPFDVPPGSTVYTAMRDEYTVGFPENWTVYHESVVEVRGRTKWGRTVFADAGDGQPAGGDAERGRIVDRAERGEVASFVVDRRESARGMSCAGFDDDGRAALLAMADAVTGRPAGGWDVEPAPLGGCAGIRLAGMFEDGAGGSGDVELRAAADGDVLFALVRIVRRDGETGEQTARRSAEAFAAAVASFRIAVAHPG